MSQGLSTRTVGSPIATAGQFSPGKKPLEVVPLSVFFLDRESGEDEASKEDGITGLKKKGKGSNGGKKDASSAKKTNAKQTKNNRKVKDDGGGNTSGGDAKSADAAAGNTQPSSSTTASQESVTMGTGTPLVAPGGPVKFGATRASSGSMGSGNVATAPVPIGKPIRRRRGKRKKKQEEGLERWISRLGTLIE